MRSTHETNSERNLAQGWFEDICLLGDITDQQFSAALALEISITLLCLSTGLLATSWLYEMPHQWFPLLLWAMSIAIWWALIRYLSAIEASTDFDEVNIALGEEGLLVLGGLKFKWTELYAIERMRAGSTRKFMDAVCPVLRLQERGELLKFYVLPDVPLEARLKTKAQRRAVKVDGHGTYVRVRIGGYSEEQVRRLKSLVTSRTAHPAISGS